MNWKKVESIEEIDYDGEVYNLHVENNHNYFANGTMVSNCHLATGKSLTTIMEKLTNVKYRVGTTGTIQDEKVSQLCLEGILGPVHRVITTRKLMDSKRVVDLNIQCLILKYPEETRKIMKDCKYQEEIDFIIGNESRNKFISNLALKQNGNTLVLFQFVAKQGKILHKMIVDRAEDGRKIFYVSGEISTEDREAIRIGMNDESNAILCASFSTFSTGINLPSIENIIFASPTKSKIRNLQSIGRGLRLSKGKISCTLYDIADNLSYKKYSNYTLNHFSARVELYAKEEFDFKLHQIEIK